MTAAERRVALEQIASEVRACTRCRLHAGRTRAVPGEGNPDTEVVFVGEGPGFNEDREGRPFVGRAGALLVRLLAAIGWRRDDVFITNVVKCRPPENRDPQPDEIAACAPFLRRQLEALDPALVVTLGRFSMGTFMPGARISQAHGTVRPVDPATGAVTPWRWPCTTRRPHSGPQRWSARASTTWPLSPERCSSLGTAGGPRTPGRRRAGRRGRAGCRGRAAIRRSRRPPRSRRFRRPRSRCHRPWRCRPPSRCRRRTLPSNRSRLPPRSSSVLRNRRGRHRNLDVCRCLPSPAHRPPDDLLPDAGSDQLTLF